MQSMNVSFKVLRFFAFVNRLPAVNSLKVNILFILFTEGTKLEEFCCSRILLRIRSASSDTLSNCIP